MATAALFLQFGGTWLADLSHPGKFASVSLTLFSVILLATFSVVRHAERLAIILEEPLGTLVLTLSVTGIEVSIITASMFTGQGHPMLARDAMFAVVMIVLNGMVGLSLLLGGLRYHEQSYNLQGANAFLAVIIPIAVLGLVLPSFTRSSPGPTFSPLQATFFIAMSLGLYGAFLAIQNSRHRPYFVWPSSELEEDLALTTDRREHRDVQSVWFHTGLLLLYFAPLVILAKQLAVPIDHGIRVLEAPRVLGGLLVAVLVLAPESLAAARAALANALQRSINILLGSGARNHQSDHPGDSDNWTDDGKADHAGARPSGSGDAVIDPVAQHLDLQQQPDERAPRRRTLDCVSGISDVDLRTISEVRSRVDRRRQGGLPDFTTPQHHDYDGCEIGSVIACW